MALKNNCYITNYIRKTESDSTGSFSVLMLGRETAKLSASGTQVLECLSVLNTQVPKPSKCPNAQALDCRQRALRLLKGSLGRY